MTTLKALPQAITSLLPVGNEVKIATTNGMYVHVFLQNGEVWEFKNSPTPHLLGKKEYEIPTIGKSKIKTLGFPYGLHTWGHELSLAVTGCDYALMGELKDNPNSGKTRVKFTLEEDVVIGHHWTRPVIIKKGRYDYMIPTPAKQDWSGWFND